MTMPDFRRYSPLNLPRKFPGTSLLLGIALSAATTAGASEPALPDASQLTQHISNAAFELDLRKAGSYEKGKPAKIEIVLVAKAPFKANKDYPYKFKSAKNGKLKFKSEVSRGAKVDGRRAVMTVEFTPIASGSQTVSGKFYFSVCTEKQCRVERENLSLPITVK